MSYLDEFKTQINNRDFHKFFQLWEEYCTSDHVDPKEFIQLLDTIKESDFRRLFGQLVETALPLWQCIEDKKEAYNVLKGLIDLETTNTSILADIAFQALKDRYGDEPKFRERIRQVGLRARENFQGALSNYDLLRHLEKGKFVFHTGGWGTGEVMDVSPIREQAAIEFENVTGIKYLTFENAFKTLIPLEDDHLLARRFADPDLLEAQAKKNPVRLMKDLLRDLGPKTASEIKEELCVLVIPEKEWAKWWQNTRSKLKKDTMVESANSLREPFKLREKEISHEEELDQEISEETDVNAIIQKAYTFARDLPSVFRKQEVKDSLRDNLLKILDQEDLSREQELQIILFLESMFEHQVEDRKVKDFIRSMETIDDIINQIDIAAFKKKALFMVRKFRSDWVELFSRLLYTIQPNSIKDYILKELNDKNTKDLLEDKIKNLLLYPTRNPEAYIWYFQRLIKKNPGSIPYSSKEGQCKFLEGFLILLHHLEQKNNTREMTKKMYNILTTKRFVNLRYLLEGTAIDFVKEFLLLTSKCQTFSDHEKKIMRSLAHVVQPSLAPVKKKKGPLSDRNVLWTTEEGYLRTQGRAKHIATVEMVQNAKEVEEARALGDLRENAEYKFACERRARLQGELKMLGKQLNMARILTPLDISADEVGVGHIVAIETPAGELATFTILGPWEADPSVNIISYQSKFAQAMAGCGVGDQFTFRDEEYTIREIKSYLNGHEANRS